MEELSRISEEVAFSTSWGFEEAPRASIFERWGFEEARRASSLEHFRASGFEASGPQRESSAPRIQPELRTIDRAFEGVDLLYLSIYLSVCLSVYLSIYLS